MPTSTDNLMSGAPFPDTMLELLISSEASSDDIWKRRFQALIEQLPIMLYTAAPDDLSKIEYTSSKFTRWLGYDAEEWIGSPEQFEDRLHPEDRDRVLNNDDAAIATGDGFTIEYRLQARDGTWHWVRDSAILLRDSSGVGLAWQGVTVDITDLKAAEARQIEARRLYSSLIEQVPAIVFRESVDPEPAPLYVSPRVEELLGYTPEEWCQSSSIWSRIMHPNDRHRLAGRYDHDNGSPIHDEYRVITKDGRTIWVREDRDLVVDEQGNPRCWQGLLIDITRQKQLEEQLIYQARHDPLTGLPNRSYFSDLVAEALDRGAPTGQPIALLFLDLDGFKTLNDSLGHHSGDTYLVEIANQLRRALRPGDVVARLGGDEFAILVNGPVNPDNAAAIAGRVLATLRRPHNISGREVNCSGSLGIAIGTSGVDSLSDLLRWADVAMYSAKASGKNRYAFYDPAT